MDAVCAAKHTASIRPTVFENWTYLDPEIVTFSPNDAWIPLFKNNYLRTRGTSRDSLSALKKDLLVYHTSYPHIWYTFLIFGILCYFPWYLWKTKENGFMASATKDMDKLPTNPDTLQNHVKVLRQNIFNRDQGTLVSYLSWSCIAEFLAVLNLISISLFCNWMLDYQLFHYGISYFNYMRGSHNLRGSDVNPILYYWPPTTLCGMQYLIQSSLLNVSASEPAKCWTCTNRGIEPITTTVYYVSSLRLKTEFSHLAELIGLCRYSKIKFYSLWFLAERGAYDSDGKLLSLTSTICVLVYNNLYGRVSNNIFPFRTECNCNLFQIFLFLWIAIPALIISSLVGWALNIIFNVCSPLRRLMFCFRGLLTNNHKDILKWDRLCRRYTLSQMNVILLYQRNVNQEIFKSFLAHLSAGTEEEKPKDVWLTCPIRLLCLNNNKSV